MKKLLVVCLAAMLTLLAPSASWALCTQTAGQADRDLWADHDCWREYYLWHYRAYDMHESDWRGRGWNDACNVNMEFPKHWNSGFLVTYGLADNLAQSFHGTADYRATGEAAESNFHEHLKHVPTDRTDIFGAYGDHQIKIACPRFDGGPGERAGDFMHEGWHAWLELHDYNNGSAGGHRPCTAQPDGSCRNGNCTMNGCDYFYFHGIGAYAFGAMWEDDGTANRFHSPNQVQIEFQCDLVDQPKNWVPASVRQGARAEVNTRSAERFINGPGYYCGDSRPW